jgi:membrane protein YqaA with SNARE-associated domain
MLLHLARFDVSTLLTPTQLFATSFGVAFVSGFVPLVTIEAYVVSAIVMGGASSWLPIVIASTLGQMLAKSLLYLSGRGLVRLPFTRHPKKLLEIQAWLQRREAHSGMALFLSAMVGFPPFYILSLLAGSLRIPFPLFLGAGLLGRFLRFSLFAWFPKLMMRFVE